METRAHYGIIGGLVLLFIVGVFTFVYWLQNPGGLGRQAEYRIQFNEPAPGLTTGATVLFNGVRVGSITALELTREQPGRMTATIAIDPNTPVRSDTQATVTFIGLTGAPAILLKGGAPDAPPLAAAGGAPPLLVAAAGAAQTLTDSARDTLSRLDKILDDNAVPFNKAVTGIANFADALSRNSGKVDGILGGLEKMLGGGPQAQQPKRTYDLDAPTNFPDLTKKIEGQMEVSDPTSILAFDTQKVLIRTAEGTFTNVENVEWADTLPKLFQARVVQGFENASQLNSVSRPLDQLNAANKLELNIRNFAIVQGPSPAAVVEFSARILAENGEIKNARLFTASVPAGGTEAPQQMRALNDAFVQATQELVVWTVNAL